MLTSKTRLACLCSSSSMQSTESLSLVVMQLCARSQLCSKGGSGACEVEMG